MPPSSADSDASASAQLKPMHFDALTEHAHGILDNGTGGVPASGRNSPDLLADQCSCSVSPGGEDGSSDWLPLRQPSGTDDTDESTVLSSNNSGDLGIDSMRLPPGLVLRKCWPSLPLETLCGEEDWPEELDTAEGHGGQAGGDAETAAVIDEEMAAQIEQERWATRVEHDIASCGGALMPVRNTFLHYSVVDVPSPRTVVTAP